MAQKLNLTSDPYRIVEYQIETSRIKVESRWNKRAQAWFISFYDSTGNALLTSLKLIPNEPRCLTFRNRVFAGLDNYFTGNFYCFPIEDSSVELGYNNLGVDWDIYYLTASEESALFALV
jgi:hypothetical protein